MFFCSPKIKAKPPVIEDDFCLFVGSFWENEEYLLDRDVESEV